MSAPTANQPPVLQLLSVPTITQPGAQVNLYAIASDPEGDPLTYAWDTDGDGAFDDGNGSFLDYAFPEVGAVDVRVRVTDGKGGERIGLQTAHVRPDAGLPPTFNNLYIPGKVRVGQPTTLYASASSQSGGLATLTFELDGDGLFDEKPTGGFGDYVWTFTSPDPITIGVKATDAAGNFTVRTGRCTRGRRTSRRSHRSAPVPRPPGSR